MLLFENFNGIHSICRKYRINNYTINSDGSIDVYGDVDLSNFYLAKIPLKFNKVTGFFCHYNKLTTLEGDPKIVDTTFNCSWNQLVTLEGGPKEVGSIFDCVNNPIYQIVRLFKNYKEFKELLDDYNYLRGNRIIKVRFAEACIEARIKMPENIEGYVII